jgi:hypothetical protein
MKKERNRRGNVSENEAHNICKKRMDFGECHSLFLHLVEDEVRIFQYFRMTHKKFTFLLALLKPDRSRESTLSKSSEKFPTRRTLIEFSERISYDVYQ